MNPLSDEQALSVRINTHGKFAMYEVNDWILRNLKLKRSEKVLDIGCGSGKQLIPFARMVGHDGLAFGVDVSEELLQESMEAAERADVSIKLKKCGMEELVECIGKKQKFDAIASSFAIYYSKDIKRTVSDIHLLLKDGGRVFVCGPTLGNNRELAKLHAKVAPLPRKFIEHTEFMAKVALPTFKTYFKRVRTSVFRNSIAFPNKKAVLEYWNSYTLFNEKAKARFESAVEEHFRRNATFTTHKVVLGMFAKK